jgi:hypothetical protein
MRKARLASLVAVLALAALAQQNSGTLKGRVRDSSGAVIPGVAVSVTAGSIQRTATTDQAGAYRMAGLPPGTYTVRVTAPGFGVFDSKVDVASGTKTLDIGLEVAVERQQVTVEAEGAPQVSTEASNNAGALVLRGKELDALSDDPDDLQADLQALAGPSAGPNGGEIYVDGFTNARLPPKASIREIRINQNPFSSEYDHLGYGRIEILTKPGTDNLHGQLYFNDSDAIFNSRNPFAENKPDFRMRRFGGDVSGPLSKRASLFLDFERRDIDDNALVPNIDPANFVPGSEFERTSIVTPQERTSFSPRLDYQLTQNQTLVVRYGYERTSLQNTGLTSSLALRDQAYDSLNTEHDVQATDTIVVSPRTVNETRFHFERNLTDLNGNDSTFTTRTPDFVFGGAAVGHSVQADKRYELQNYTTMVLGSHGLKFGIRLRAITLDDVSPQNFAGTFLFDSVQQYQDALNAAPGTGVATQFTIAMGTPQSRLSRIDAAPFFQDDWRVRPNLTLSLGLRYETQTNIHDWHDIAPRVGFAWAPGGGAKRSSKTVIRGGFGIFYDRFSENLTLQADRFNGGTQQQFIISNPAFYPFLPTPDQLAAGQRTLYQVQPGLRAPRMMQAALGVEHQLPWNTTIASTFMFSKGEHLLRTVNVNSPLPSTAVPLNGLNEVIYQYQSSGAYRQEQWITNINSRINKNISLFAFYVLGKSMSDTDGAGTFPSNTYDLAQDWGRSSMDVRHRFMMGGSIMTPGGFQLSPFIIARTGAPFNITTGTDLNHDTLFTDRPAFAAPGQGILTPWGWLNPNPQPGDTIIPRNYGQSPGYFAINLRLTKAFGFGEPLSSSGGQGGGFRGGAGPFATRGRHSHWGATTNRRYNLTFSISARNLLNTTNAGPVVGNLSSGLFGQSVNLASSWGPASTAGNRRIELGLRFSF